MSSYSYNTRNNPDVSKVSETANLIIALENDFTIRWPI